MTAQSATKYIGQPTQYAAADGTRLSILVILDMSRKVLPIGTPENYLFVLTTLVSWTTLVDKLVASSPLVDPAQSRISRCSVLGDILGRSKGPPMEDDKRSRFSEIEFQQFLLELASRMDFGRVQREQDLGARLRPDIVVEGHRQLMLIEVRRTVPQTERRIDDLISQLTEYRTVARRQRQEWTISAVLAIPGALSRDNIQRLDANGIQVWQRS